MMRSNRSRVWVWVFCVCGFVLWCAGDSRGGGDDELGLVRVGMLVYAGDKTAQCFSGGFLDTVARTTGINVDRHLHPVRLDSDALYDYPFVIMAGTGSFELGDHQRDRLGAYLRRGGFVLASAGCSDPAWAASFRGVVREIFGDGVLKAVGLEHPVFHMVYEVERLTTRQAGMTGEVYGVRLGAVAPPFPPFPPDPTAPAADAEGRLVVLFSPTGLNDTDNAGGGCCCCGGNEFLDAGRINANVLVYTLTH